MAPKSIGHHVPYTYALAAYSASAIGEAAARPASFRYILYKRHKQAADDGVVRFIKGDRCFHHAHPKRGGINAIIGEPSIPR